MAIGNNSRLLKTTGRDESACEARNHFSLNNNFRNGKNKQEKRLTPTANGVRIRRWGA